MIFFPEITGLSHLKQSDKSRKVFGAFMAFSNSSQLRIICDWDKLSLSCWVVVVVVSLALDVLEFIRV